MSQHNSLRKRTEQHKPKNLNSKIDDKDVYKSMEMVTKYIKSKQDFSSYFSTDYELEFASEIEIKYMIEFIKRKNIRHEFCYDCIDRKIVPDGGILYLVDIKNDQKFPLVIAEIKRQGTNNEREKEGNQNKQQAMQLKDWGKI